MRFQLKNLKLMKIIYFWEYSWINPSFSHAILIQIYIKKWGRNFFRIKKVLNKSNYGLVFPFISNFDMKFLISYKVRILGRKALRAWIDRMNLISIQRVLYRPTFPCFGERWLRKLVDLELGLRGWHNARLRRSISTL